MVEDELSVREVVVSVLPTWVIPMPKRRCRCRTGAAGRQSAFDLMILMWSPPGMNYRQLAEIAMDRRPGLKVLFVTGYAEQAAVRNGLLKEGMQMITKPFVIEELANRIRSILQAEENTPAP